MANTTDVAASAADELSETDLDRVREFSREPILVADETIAELAPGTARRRAVDDALVELDAGAEAPSLEWRRNYSLLLGLERLLAEEPPKLLDGAELNDHQVDALSGTLAAIVAEIEGTHERGEPNGRNGSKTNGHGTATATNGNGAPVAELDEEESCSRPTRSPRTGRSPRTRTPRRSPRRPRTPAPTAGSGSSTPPAPARRSPRSASSTPRAPAGC